MLGVSVPGMRMHSHLWDLVMGTYTYYLIRSCYCLENKSIHIETEPQATQIGLACVWMTRGYTKQNSLNNKKWM